MRVGVAFRPARSLSLLIVAVALLALIISTALVHVVPQHSSDGASHVSGITNPVTGAAAELASGADEPSPAHHEHFEIDHDGTVPPRAVDTVGSVADVPSVAYSLFASPEQILLTAPLRPRALPAPSLAALSISRT
jgi:hypothetical protein